MERRRDQGGDGTAFRLLAIAYLFWALVMTLSRVSGLCAPGLACRIGGSSQLSMLIVAAPLALIVGTLATRRHDERVRLLAIAAATAALIMAPDIIGRAVGGVLEG